MTRRFDRADTREISKWWRTVDRYMIFNIGFIIMIGTVLIMAASPVVAERIGLSSFHFVNRQAIYLIIGIILMISISFMDVIFVRRVAILSFVACILLLISVQIFGAEIKGAKRWLSLGGLAIQPSEFTKPFFAIIIGWVLSRRNTEHNFHGFKIALVIYLLVVFLLMIQPDFGMTLAISSIWGTQMFLAGLSFIWIGGIIMVGIAGIISAYLFFPHVAGRIDTFLDPSSGDNFQVARSLEAFINGGFLGVGPGEGVIKEIIPDSHTDFIFAVAGEEFGVVCCILIVALFASLVGRGFYRIYNEKNLFIFYATAGLLVQIGIQAVINMGVAINVLPNTGMTLPFISYGGSSTVAISIAMGMVLAFTRKRYGRIQ